jgi:hypothetical protein
MRGKKMAKLAKMKYKTMGGDVKINTYNATISKKIVAESGIDPEKEITVRAETGKIIIEQKR